MEVRSSMNFWDQNFSVPGYKYGTAPNAFLVQQAYRVSSASHILVPGDGEGRNSVWLAQQGHQVTAMDSSSVGLQKTQKLAAERKVSLQTELADLADWTPAPASADAVVLTFVHLPPSIRASAHRRLAGALRPGGCLLLEAFHPLQLGHTSGGPKAPEMLYTLAMLREDFAGVLTEESGWEGETTLDEGPGHQGLAHVTRWIGRVPKPV